jgi:hypothetical protein
MRGSLFNSRAGAYKGPGHYNPAWTGPSRRICILDILRRYQRVYGVPTVGIWNSLVHRMMINMYGSSNYHAEYIKILSDHDDTKLEFKEPGLMEPWEPKIMSTPELHEKKWVEHKDSILKITKDEQDEIKAFHKKWPVLTLKALPKRHNIDTKFCGIYFLFQDGELQYVGESSQVHKRIQSHVGRKVFDSFTWVKAPVDPAERRRLERCYIEKHNPKLNKM